MKPTLSLLALFGSLTLTQAFPSYDPFADATGSGGSSYLAGSDLWKQTNAMGDPWYGANTGNAGGHLVLTNLNLSYPGLPASTGNSVKFRNVSGGPGARIFVATNASGFFATNMNATVYYSLILQVQDLTAITAGGDYDIGFNNQGALGDQSGQPGVQGARLYLKKNGTNYQVGIAKNSAVVAYDPTLRSRGDTLFVVAAYEIIYNDSSPSPTDDNVRLWINPSSATFGAPTPPTETTNLLAVEPDINAVVSSLVLLNRTTASANSMTVDDVRLGKTWAFVTGGPEFAPSLPTNSTAIYSFPLTLAAPAKSGGPSAVSYRWQRSGTNLVDGGNISGATTSSLTVSNFTAADVVVYSIIASNAMGTATNSTTITLLDPYITTHPTNKLTVAGFSASFSVAAVGTPALAYQWQRDATNLVEGGNIAGSTTASLTVSSVSATDAASYSCIVSNGLGNTATSSNAILTVLPSDPGFVSQPQDLTTNYGGTASFSALALGSGTITYRWQLNGVDLTNGPSGSGSTVSGVTTANLTITPVSYLDAATYSVNATNGANASVSSSDAVLVVRDPFISTQPASRTNVVGTTATFTVVAGGTPALSYGWYKDNVQLSDGNEISGSASSTLTISPVGNFDIGSYYAVVGSGSGSNVTSATVTLKVLSATPQTALYWDGNGTNAGSGDAPFGTWGTSLFWNTDVDGSLTPGGWLDGSTAVFSAGTDEGSPYAVTVSSVQIAAGLTFEEGDVTVNSGTISFASTNAQSTIFVADTRLATIGSVLAGTNDLVKTGPGRLRLNANNTFSGRTIIKEGTVSVQGDSRFGALPLSFRADEITLDGGTLECDAVGNPGQQSNPVRGMTITTNNGTIAETAANGTGALTFFGSITGPGKLTKTGGAVLRLEATNSYSGGTDLNDGKIYVNASGGLGTGVLTINTTAGMILRTTLATATTVTVTNSIVLLAGANPLISAGGNGTAAHFEVDGVISGDGSLTRGVVAGKDVIFTGANTYLGGTTVDVGRLLVNNTTGSGTGSGGVTVNPAGTLGGNGTITGAVTTVGGTIAAGSSAGKLTLQSGLDMSAGGTNVWELAALKDDSTGTAGTDFDQVALTGGTLNLNGATLAVSFIGSASAPDPTNVFWQAAHTWTIVALSGTAANPGPSNFTAGQDPVSSAGVFTINTAPNGSIRLHFTPGPLAIQTVNADATTTTISWNAFNGVPYVVQYKTNLSEGDWMVLTNVTGAGSLISITDNHGADPQRFYRLSVTP